MYCVFVAKQYCSNFCCLSFTVPKPQRAGAPPPTRSILATGLYTRCISGVECCVDFVVMHNLQHSVILGMDMLRDHQTVIDICNYTMCYENFTHLMGTLTLAPPLWPRPLFTKSTRWRHGDVTRHLIATTRLLSRRLSRPPAANILLSRHRR